MILEKQEKEDVSIFRVFSYMVLTMLYGLLLEKVGFLITSALFILLILKYTERQGWRMTILFALADRGISINIRNEMSIEDVVNETGVWIYQTSNQDQSHANP
jgi:hypothetical protein